MNVCYNKLALKAHNLKRLAHKDTPPLGPYDAAAKAIQAFMDKPNFNGKMPRQQ
jgi:hypothetical protein